MEMEKKIKILQAMYAGALADSVLRMGREGILEKVTVEKKGEQMASGKIRAAQLVITKPQEVFEVLPEIFGCANWKTEDTEQGFKAEATGCMLCGLAKNMEAQSPCHIYCLDPMEAMVKGVDERADYKVQETLWDGEKCLVLVSLK
ncbi:MAG TPA: hypothetical protein DCG34_06080 [Clostridiales bacterium]|nr:hypothetical protein [Clostridiales bacterium]